MESTRIERRLTSRAKAARPPTRREVLQREIHAERRRLGRLVHEHGLPSDAAASRRAPRAATTVMMLLLSYKIRDLAAQLAALDAGAARTNP
jgi:hypothetical protein